MPRKVFVYPVLRDTFIRREQVIERGRVLQFVIQLEVEIPGEPKPRPVIRYDTAHGFAHMDRYNLKGEQRKERLGVVDLNQALTLAERDIGQNWPRYREQFLKGGFP